MCRFLINCINVTSLSLRPNVTVGMRKALVKAQARDSPSDKALLTAFARIKTLKLLSYANEILAVCTALQHLDMSESFEVTHISAVAECTALKHLDIGHTSVVDIGPLAACKALKHLNIQGTGVTTLVPLASCTSLKHIDCNNTLVTALDPLAACKA